MEIVDIELMLRTINLLFFDDILSFLQFTKTFVVILLVE